MIQIHTTKQLSYALYFFVKIYSENYIVLMISSFFFLILLCSWFASKLRFDEFFLKYKYYVYVQCYNLKMKFPNLFQFRHL